MPSLHASGQARKTSSTAIPAAPSPEIGTSVDAAGNLESTARRLLALAGEASAAPDAPVLSRRLVSALAPLLAAEHEDAKSTPPASWRERLDAAGLGRWPDFTIQNLDKLDAAQLLAIAHAGGEDDPVLDLLERAADDQRVLDAAEVSDETPNEDTMRRVRYRVMMTTLVAAELHKRQRAILEHAADVGAFLASLPGMTSAELLEARKRADELNSTGSAPHLRPAVEAALDRLGSPFGREGRAKAHAAVAQAVDELNALALAVRNGERGATGRRAYARWDAATKLLWTRGGSSSPRLREGTKAVDELDPVFGARHRAESQRQLEERNRVEIARRSESGATKPSSRAKRAA